MVFVGTVTGFIWCLKQANERYSSAGRPRSELEITKPPLSRYAHGPRKRLAFVTGG